MMAEQLDPEDVKLVVLARAAMTRAEAGSPTAAIILTDRTGTPL